jgi:chemotaxis protein methyltransferase CheR
VAFLQWALPQLRLRWPGFRKVRGQVRKRLQRRLEALELKSIDDYRTHLEGHPDEWRTLDTLCRITISRFYRDRRVFDFIGEVLLPRLAMEAAVREDFEVRCWCVGCCSGEEAYTLQIVWRLRGELAGQGRRLQVVATDADAALLKRARSGRYRASAVKDLPADLANRAFDRSGDEFVLREAFKEGVSFAQQDVRDGMPPGPFDVILCRTFVFTYFEEELQAEILTRVLDRLRQGGALVVGHRESLPPGEFSLEPEAPAAYQKVN